MRMNTYLNLAGINDTALLICASLDHFTGKSSLVM